MLKNVGIGKKIAFGFGAVLILLGIVGIWSIVGIGGIVDNASEVIDGNKLRGEMVQKEVDHLNWANKVNALLTDENVTELNVQTDPHKCAFGKWYYGEGRKHAEQLVPALVPIMADIEKAHTDLHQSAEHIGKVFVQADIGLSEELQAKKVDHLAWAHKVKDVFINHSLNHADVGTDGHKCAFGKWYYSEHNQQLRKTNRDFDQVMARVEEPHKHLHESAGHINELLARGKREEAADYYMRVTAPAASEVLEAIDGIIAWNNRQVEGMTEADRIYASTTRPNLEKVQHLLTEANKTVEENVMTDEAMLQKASQTKTAVTVFSLIAAMVGIFLAITISRGIIKAMRPIIGRLSEGSEQVGAASEQVASASQSLAEGASVQASSLEETSSSLEEMSGMTRQNASNASQANTIANQANDAAARGTGAMNGMSNAMQEIKTSSDETAKIIKVIDEIAFQTNLLALNAAVEAARAGDAGKGFAVVAEEVRNLAQRSAEAAKNTNELIEGSQRNADNGVKSVEELNEIFKDITDANKKVADLISEVSAASDEQAQGIDQVNRAVSQMDQITQQNASNAEESSSASEELAAQAQELQQVVGELTVIVNGAKNGEIPESRSTAPPSEKPKITSLRKKRELSVSKKNTGKPEGRKIEKDDSIPEKVIPLEEAEEAELAGF